MTLSVVNTVLTSTFLTTLLVCILYFVRRHLRPHLERTCNNSEPTSPRTLGNTDPQLRQTLYSLPSLNFIDPRNSIADCDLTSSRWSTNILDLSPPQSPTRATFPRSPRMPLSPISTRRSSAHSRQSQRMRPVMRLENIHRSQSSKDGNMATPSSTPGQVRIPRLLVHPEPFHDERRDKRYRPVRSNSDSMVYMQNNILARSHALLHGPAVLMVDPSPTISTFSGTTLLSGPRTPHRYGATSQGRRMSAIRIPASEPRMNRIAPGLQDRGFQQGLPRTTHLTSSQCGKLS